MGIMPLRSPKIKYSMFFVLSTNLVVFPLFLPYFVFHFHCASGREILKFLIQQLQRTYWEILEGGGIGGITE
jgi:hypothetical protein